MATKTKTTKTNTTKTKADPYAKVTDNVKESSADLVWSLMTTEADYQTRVAAQGPILAKRVANGEKQADIGRELQAIAAAKGRRLSREAAAMRVSRYVRIGEAIVKGGKDAKVEDIITKASAKVRKGGANRSPKSTDEKVAIALDTLVKLLAKANRAELEKADNAVTTVLVDAIARRYAELDAAEKVA